MLTAHGATHPGRVRKMNEDTFFCDPAIGLFAVADGMGGHNAGEIASTIAIETLQSFVCRTQESDKFTWPFGFDSRVSYPGNCLMTSMRLANRRVFKAAESQHEYTGMGTTLTVALVSGDSLTYASVGDSRLYSFRDNRLEPLTVDDSWVAKLVAENPSMDPRALSTHPMRNVLTKVIGVSEDVGVATHERALTDGELLLICSDGLHALVDADAIRQTLTADSIVDAVDRLVQRALDQGGTDNVTAVLVRYSASQTSGVGTQP
jgi:serine/threonine protein phosphatase PrpC